MDWQAILFYSAAVIVLLAVARFLNQFVFRTKLTESLIDKDNPAFGIEMSGNLMGVILIISAVLSGPGHESLWQNIFWVGVYGVGGILFLSLVTAFGLRFILSDKFIEAINNRNVAAGIVSGGCYVGIAAVIAGAVNGDGSGPWTAAVVFFVIGIVTFIVITYVFRLLTSYDDTKEVLNGNIPAALSYAGIMIAVGIIVGNALDGHFYGWEASFIDFGKALLVVIALYPIRQFLVQSLLLGGAFSLYGGRLDDEIERDKNVNAGIIEAVTYVSTAILVTGLLK